MNPLRTILIFATFILVSSSTKNEVDPCGCTSEDECCSVWGYCGTTYQYCGSAWCVAGACTPETSSSIIPDLVTNDFFDGIIKQANPSCDGVKFYTRDAFLDALKYYPEFGNGTSLVDTKREVAAFFAHLTHETGHFCHKIGFEGLNALEIVSKDPKVFFRTALAFWMNNVHSTLPSQGFEATINALDGGKQKETSIGADKARTWYYALYCNQLGVSPWGYLSSY